ncbi:MAG: hypothetical protein M0010_11200 [Actinomycetota bacterium]|nr:hypothetical protein [Actinomycetota bacterium]
MGATVASVVVSLVLNVLAVHVATTQFPSTRHFVHFEGADYGTLTVVGVLVAAGAWAVIVRLSSAARWLFFRIVVVAMLVLWIPDVVLFALGEAAKGVATLMVMHLLVAVVTYNLLVRVAHARGSSGAVVADDRPSNASQRLPDQLVRRVWSTMALVVVLELALGVGVIVSVPFRRPAAIIPARGTWIYAMHGAVGIALGIGALSVYLLSALAGRMGRIGAVLGVVGVGVGLVGGVLATFQSTRLPGMGVMLVGVVVAAVGYLAPSLEAMGKAEAARAEAARAGARAAGQARRPDRGETWGPGEEKGPTGDEAVKGPAPGEIVSSNGHGATPPAI